MLAYFLKINVAIALFYAFYRLFFYKDTFFTWRRAALLCFFAVSAVYPLLNIQTWITAQEPMVAMADLYAGIVLPEFTLIPEKATDWKTIMLQSAGFVYWGVVAALTARFFVQLAGILRLACRCRKTKIGNTNVHLLRQAGGPFSFFRWIFIYPASHTEEEMSEILTHEQTHANQWHSIDVLVSETACVLCWFNPFAWLMKREVRTNLEYLADNRVLETGHDSKAYQYHLLGLSHHKAAATIYNSFNVLPLKKRIKMMNKKRTREIGRTKYLMFLPLAALLMIISNIETVARTTKAVARDVIEAVEVSQQAKDTLVKNKPEIMNPEEDVVFEVVEEMPVYPNGGMSGLMQYLAKNIKYPVNAQTKGIQGRVSVQFIVNKDGSISDVKTIRPVDPDLDAEALRVIKAMPKWIPGKQRGKEVRVRYTVPIMFGLQKDAPKQEEYKPVEKVDETVVVGYVPQEGNPNDAEVTFMVVEEMPSFPGGPQGLMQYLAKNIKYPVEAQTQQKQGRVVLEVIIDKNGNVTNPKVTQSADPLLDAEAIRLALNMPKWQPGKQKGETVNVRYTFPIVFRLQ